MSAMSSWERLIEEEAARHLLRSLAGEDPRLIDKPDAPGTGSGPGKKPDYIFEDSCGQRYVVEVGRLEEPTVRQLQDFVTRQICEPLRSRMSGRFVLEIPYRRMTLAHADHIRTGIEGLLSAGTLPDVFEPAPACELQWVDDEPHDLVAWVVAPDVPWNLPFDAPQMVGIRNSFASAVLEADEKLACHRGRRMLLLTLSQSRLDREAHVYSRGRGEEALPTWMAELKVAEWDRLTNVAEVYVDCGIRVWRPSGAREGRMDSSLRVLTGQRFADRAGGILVRLWPQPVILV